MIPMCADSVKERVIEVLKKCKLYRKLSYDWESISKAMLHDKKADGDTVTVTFVNEIGGFEIKKMRCTDLIEMAKNTLKGV